MASTEKLLDGFKRFQTQYFGDDSRLYASMKDGQPAKTLMIACCDSRVDPATLFLLVNKAVIIMVPVPH